ncbi:MAG: hypothetical protein J0I84_17165 [Terrimonas sp.]|nr:hypothetical protein [Terrimonas sp.]OJY96915.1 MAG: hypothetical protein BGP13_24855 [Sphingobacteriales bacterium 40-81]
MIAIVYWSLISFFPTLLSAGKHEPDYNHHAYYDIIRNNKIIGYMKCSKLGNTETTEYINESSAKFSAIIDIAVYSKLQSSFRNGILEDGKLIRLVNGKTKADKHIIRSKDQYLINNDGKSASIKSSIHFSTACLMYAEPSGMKYIFSENFGKYIAVSQTAPHIYTLRLPDGDNIYTYQNGKCIQVEVQTTLATIYIRPRQ